MVVNQQIGEFENGTIPLIWLMFFAYAFAFSGISLEKAWKAKKFKLIWLYIWIILVGLYFLFCRN
jgi:hypothetical protein